MQDPPKVASDLLSIRRQPGNSLVNASNTDSQKLKMALAEKSIAETMFATAFKEKEIIRLQAIKAVELLKGQLRKSEQSVQEATNRIYDLSKKIDDNAVHNSINEEEIHNLQNKNTILKNEVSLAVLDQTQQQKVEEINIRSDLEEQVQKLRTKNGQLKNSLLISVTEVSRLEAELKIEVKKYRDAVGSNMRVNNTVGKGVKSDEDHEIVTSLIDDEETWRDSIEIVQSESNSPMIGAGDIQKQRGVAVVGGADGIDVGCQLSGVMGSAISSAHQTALDTASLKSFQLRINLLKSKLSNKTREISATKKNHVVQVVAVTEEARKMKDELSKMQEELAITFKASDDKSLQILQLQEILTEVEEQNKSMDLEITETVNQKNLLQNECASLRKEMTNSKNVLETESEAALEAEKMSSSLIKNLMTELVEKESVTKKLHEKRIAISEKMNENMSSTFILETENVVLKTENEKLILRLNDVDILQKMTSRNLTDEYISLCGAFTEQSCQIATLHGEILVWNQEVQDLTIANQQLNQVFYI
jgi:chromosome segregation ATPase